MDQNAAPVRVRARVAVLVVLGATAFAVAYGQAPLYYSNQNQYFLHGLASAGVGSLNEDWLANTLDPTPVFSALVSVTARYLHPWLFHVYHGLILAIYAAAMLGLFAWLAGPEMAARRWPIYLALLMVVHAAAARWLSCQLLDLDYPWYLQTGVAGQYVLGGMLQPSVFGVLLVVSVCLFVRGWPRLAVVTAVLGATVHSTYLLPAGLLTAGFVTALVLEREARRAFLLGRLALGLVLPVTAWTFVTFSPSGMEMDRFTEAQDILVNVRIPHHCRPELWLDPIAGLQIAWIGVSLALVWRTRLFPVLAVPAALAALLTLTQMATGSHSLALLFPWRISSVLVPIATTVVLSRLVAMRALPLDRPAVQVGGAIIMVLLAGAGVGICATGQAFRSGDEDAPLMEYVRNHRQPGDMYYLPVRVPDLTKTTFGSLSGDFKAPADRQKDKRLIPVDLQRFRLVTGAAIFVDFKSIPYKDTDVIEWHRRLLNAREVYELIRAGNPSAPLRVIRQWDANHVVVPAGIDLRGHGMTRLPFDDPHYQIYRFTDE